MKPLTADHVIKELRQNANPAKARVLQGFFKTGPGQYGEGDVFWGITVPQTRAVAKRFPSISLDEIPHLLKNPVHEVRLCGVLLMVQSYPREPEGVFQMYLKNMSGINNWDLVDLSADKIVGRHLEGKSKALLDQLVKSKNVWERRVAIVATFHDIKRGSCESTLRIAEKLLWDPHDLIHKATGWMLREAAKRCSQPSVEGFLKKHAVRMPRTMLRYTIERFSPEKRAAYMKIKPV